MKTQYEQLNHENLFDNLSDNTKNNLLYVVEWKYSLLYNIRMTDIKWFAVYGQAFSRHLYKLIYNEGLTGTSQSDTTLTDDEKDTIDKVLKTYADSCYFSQYILEILVSSTYPIYNNFDGELNLPKLAKLYRREHDNVCEMIEDRSEPNWFNKIINKITGLFK